MQMKKQSTVTGEMIAPCGMNCALCCRYQALVNGLKRSHCTGCRPRKTKCTYLFKNCAGPKKHAGGKTGYCFECGEYPCKRIRHMDKRYRTSYRMSVIENLDEIKKLGMKKFLKRQNKKHRCRKCGGLVCVHNGKCFHCEEITRLVEKAEKKR